MKRAILLFVAMLAASSMALAADTYTFDGAHSSANFTVRHLGISLVHGRFADVSGTVLFDEKAPEKSSVTAVIKAASINTDIAMRDKDLNSEGFFDTGKYPEIRFQSTGIRKDGDKYLVAGNLTIKDVTKQVEIPFTLAQGKGTKGESRLGALGNLTINRLDYHVSKLPGVVGDDVNIELSVEAVKQ
jgi:polyisoprenoid-binding protein YceI